MPLATTASFHAYGVFIAPQHAVNAQVTSVDGLEEVAAMPGVRVVIPLAMGGTRTEGFQDTLIAAILAVAGTPEQAVQQWRRVMDTVRVGYREGDVVAGHYRRTPKSTSSAEGGAGVVELVPYVMRAYGAAR
jgi:hypothetical protein